MASAAGAGASHRADGSASTLASQRGMLAAGGAIVVLGQVAFSHVSEADAPVLPDLAGALANVEPTAAEVAEPVSAAFELPAGKGVFEPVAPADVPAQADVDSLVKAAKLAETAELARQTQLREAEAAARAVADKPSVRGTKCAPNNAGLAGVKSFVGDAGVWLRCIFDVDTVGGLGKRSNASEHPLGLALDFMVGRSAGDQLADYALRYRGELKIKYVIWRQRINYGSGWQAMEDRGSVTANHFDHVHISFNR